MKPINKVYAVTAPDDDMEFITLNPDAIQMQLSINAVLVGAGTYKIQGNLGKINTDVQDWRATNGLGTVIPDPDGWFDIVTAQTASKMTGTADLLEFIPMYYIRPVVTVASAPLTLTLNVLQQAIR